MRHVAPALVLLALFPASAAAAPITGQVKPRMTVVALAQDGRAWSAAADARGRFAVAPAAPVVTLQLRDARGRYAGPVVVGGTAARVVVGVRSGARLGRLVLARGFARPAKAVPTRMIDRTRRARARRGVPLGAGRLGLGRFATASAAQAVGAPAPTGADPDGDGVPNAIDVDDNGNGVVDAADPNAEPAPPGGVRSFTQMFLGLEQTVNANADAQSVQQIPGVMREQLTLVLLDVAANTVLDCGGLTWCSPGGTGRMESSGPNPPGASATPFPNGTDATMPLNDRGEFRLRPGGGPDDVRAGDTLIERRADGTQLAGAIGFVFSTVPAIRDWADTSGQAVRVGYPVAAGAPGTFTAPAVIGRGADGQHRLTLNFWRPQRRAIAGAEPDGYVDVGHLVYQFNVPNGTGGGSPACPQTSLSTTSPELAPKGAAPGDGGFVDGAADQASDPSRVLNVTVDLDACLTSKGLDPASPSLMVNFDLAATAPSRTSVDHANQVFLLRLG